jgi:hypothetical protein
MPRGEPPDAGNDVPESDDDSDEPSSESAQIWEHVKALRRRVAGFN